MACNIIRRADAPCALARLTIETPIASGSRHRTVGIPSVFRQRAVDPRQVQSGELLALGLLPGLFHLLERRSLPESIAEAGLDVAESRLEPVHGPA